ncbi:helix-turn-helix domain-containing protein [Klebsiella aerogenes]|uniref:helix-turn-helix domain-containing protein n=1 Tax=Klebsiella aerogenes TaxID=548 RepID=UPI003D317472
MILNLISDDNFLSAAIYFLVRDIDNLEFISTTTKEIPYGVEKFDNKVIYFIDGRIRRSDITLWVHSDNSHLVFFMVFNNEQRYRWEGVGPVLNFSDSIETVSEIIKKILISKGNDPHIYKIKFSRLTKKEGEIFKLLRSGWSISKIAEYLNCSTKTIYAHRRNISSKKGVKRFYDLHKEIHHHFK